ncbi:MAG: glucan 1,4-alpha-glucosidase [Planctomycetes bacterium]|nr:glucan 1,4-alpha-glucosidase [Planctomycetota bacterium]
MEPRWTSSAKDGVGTAIGAGSRVWFTLSHGILDEVYFPRIDEACTRDLGLVVTGAPDFFSEEKRDTQHRLEAVAPGVPAYRLTNTCTRGRYRVEKTVFTDPERDVLLQQVRFEPRGADADALRVHVLLAPHLGNHGYGNTGRVGEYEGVPMLFAEGRGRALALACSAPWRARTVGFVGSSDAWTDLHRNGRITQAYDLAEDGNTALCGELELPADGRFVLALGFGETPAEAGHRALSSVRSDPARILARYRREWEAWHASTRAATDRGAAYRTSAMVLRTHESKSFPGGTIASLSIPWGFSKGDGDLGGYHLVWPRDLVETAGGLLALDARGEVLRVLQYLRTTQAPDGHWPQNMWLDGRPYWGGVQMDETALPILLVDLALRKGALSADVAAEFWPMVRTAALYLARNGPVTGQDRWEEDAGYSPYTIATEIAALVIAGERARAAGEPDLADSLQDTADVWYESIDDWTYVTDTELCRRFDVDGYYVRIAAAGADEAAAPGKALLPIKNRPPGADRVEAEDLVSPDALALVRFGLRRPDDPRIANTVRVIDALLRVELPAGPCYRRYNGDGYGEHADGAPFDGTGIGRPWPLLTLERAHYELAAGRTDAARALLDAARGFTNHDLLPEQVWDGPALPARELQPGRPSGSAMPLVWAHAEYVKLVRSLEEGAVFDTPPQVAARYGADYAPRRVRLWRFNHKLRTLPARSVLRIETGAPALVHWTADGWASAHDALTETLLPGLHRVDLPTRELPAGARVDFTFQWLDSQCWEGTDFHVEVRAT